MTATPLHRLSRLAVVLLIAIAVSSGCRDRPTPADADSSKATIETRTDATNASPDRTVDPEPTGGVPITFRTVAAKAGLDFERYDDIVGQHRILEANGGGAALFDFDRDGLLDVFLTDGCRLPLSRNDRSRQGEFFRNLGALRFERITMPSNVMQHGYTHGCAVGDIDADGFDDLYITAYGRNALWRNNGDGTFSDITETTGTQVPQWSASAAFADLDLDGDLDLYVTNYLDESDESPTLCPNAASPGGYEQCSPAVFDGVDDVLFLSDGEGGYVDATESAGIAGTRGKGLGVVICDFNGDGLPEIYVANDGQANFLFVRKPSETSQATGAPGIRYEDRALDGNVALNESGYAQASMGVTAGDYDGDGMNDLFLTNFFGDTSTLYANRGGLLFDDATRASRLGAASRRTLGWGTVFVDLDNDGWLDLLVTNGHVDDRTWMPQGEPYRMPPRVYRNRHDGTFANVTETSGDYFRSEWLGRGLAAGDLDRDGRLDAVVSHQLAPSVALRNETSSENRSIVLQLVGRSSNRNGYGTRIDLLETPATIRRELVGGGSFQSASALEVHLGLGAAEQATVRIHWPSGTTEAHAALTPGHWIAVEGRGVRRLSRHAGETRP